METVLHSYATAALQTQVEELKDWLSSGQTSWLPGWITLLFLQAKNSIFIIMTKGLM